MPPFIPSSFSHRKPDPPSPSTPIPAMEAAHPALRIAEIRTQIGENLLYYPPGNPYFPDRRPLLACMQVCIEWAETFRPLVWRKMFFSQREAHRMDKELVLKNGHHIRTLDFCDITLLLHGWFDNCTQLTYLHFAPTMNRRRQRWASPVLQNTLPAADSPNVDLDFLSPDSIDLLRALIDNNPHLATLSEYWCDLTPQQMTLFQNSLCNHHNHLSHIHLARWEATVADVQLLIDNSPKLRTFAFCIGTLHESTPPPTMPRTVTDLPSAPPLPLVPDGKAPQDRVVLDLKLIEKVDFSTSIFVGQTVPTIHIHAPKLTTYTWTGFTGSTRFSGSEPIATSFLACSTWHCPRLNSFRMMLDNDHILVGMPRMLETAEKLIDIAFERCVVSDVFLEVLVRKHCLTLRKVNLKETKGVSSTSITRILSSCPALFFFRGPHEGLHALDWIKSPWVCHKLRFLTVFLDFSGLGPAFVPPPGPGPDNAPTFRNPYEAAEQERVMMSDAQAQEIYGVIYNQLAQLPELRSINFGGWSNGKTYVMGVPWSLRSGLAKLSTLKQLDEIYVTEPARAIGVEEAEWMKENWPRLKTLWRQDDTKSVLAEEVFAKVERAFRPRVRVAVDLSGSEFPF